MNTSSSYTHYEDPKFLLKYVTATEENHELYLELLKELNVLFHTFYGEMYMNKFKLLGHMSFETMCGKMFGTKKPAIDNWAVSGTIHWMNKQGFPKSCNTKLRDILTTQRWYNYNLEKLNEQIKHSANFGHKMSICTNDFKLLEWSLKLGTVYKDMIAATKELQRIVNETQNMDANSKNDS